MEKSDPRRLFLLASVVPIERPQPTYYIEAQGRGSRGTSQNCSSSRLKTFSGVHAQRCELSAFDVGHAALFIRNAKSQKSTTKNLESSCAGMPSRWGQAPIQPAKVISTRAVRWQGTSQPSSEDGSLGKDQSRLAANSQPKRRAQAQCRLTAHLIGKMSHLQKAREALWAELWQGVQDRSESSLLQPVDSLRARLSFFGQKCRSLLFA